MAEEHIGAQRANQPKRTVRPAATLAQGLPIGEIYRLYPREWIAVRVTALDPGRAISHGEILAHSPARGDLSRALVQAHQEDPSVRTYVFRGGPIAFSVDELPRLMDEAEVHDPDAWE